MRACTLAVAALAGALACTPVRAAAADPIPESAAPLLARARAAHLRRDAGWALAAAGIAALAAGAVTLVHGGWLAPYDTGYQEVVGGGIAIGAGASLLIAGATLSIQGQNVMANVLPRLREQLAVAPLVAPLPGGALAGVMLHF
jgi:hypothetical protein